MKVLRVVLWDGICWVWFGLVSCFQMMIPRLIHVYSSIKNRNPIPRAQQNYISRHKLGLRQKQYSEGFAKC